MGEVLQFLFDGGIKSGKLDEDRLREQFGVYDNFPLLLDANTGNLIKLLQTKGFKEKAENCLDFRYLAKDPSVYIGIRNGVRPLFTTGSGFSSDSNVRDHSEIQRSYPTMATCHWGIHAPQNRSAALLQMVEFFRELTSDYKIPVCLPQSAGMANISDTSRIVYYEPSQIFLNSLDRRAAHSASPAHLPA
jgi:hypothetical protein